MFWLMDLRTFTGALAGYMLMTTAFAANCGPIVTTWLVQATGQASSVAWFMIATAILSIAAFVPLAETVRRDLAEAS